MSGPPRCGVQLLVGRRVAARSPAPRGCRPRSSCDVRRIPGRRAAHHNTHVEWKDADSRVAIAGPGRRTGRDNGAWSPGPRPAASPTPRARTNSSTREGRVIYVGKAKSLRSRLSNYFVAPELLPERTRQMVLTAESVEWIVAKNEVDAFFLEFNLIKRHKPRFNIRLKDDKSYPFLAVTLDEEWPRAMVLRGQEAQGRALLRSVRARVRDPRDARPAAAHVPDPHVHERRSSTATTGSAGRASTRTSRSARRRASATSSATTTTSSSRSSSTSSTASTTRSSSGSSSGWPTRPTSSSSSWRRACATSSRACARRSSASRWSRRAKRTSTCIGLDEDALEASVQVFYVRKGRVVGRKGLHRRQGRGPRAARARSRASSSSSTPTPTRRRRAQGDPRPGRARGLRALRGVPRAEPRLEGAHPRAAARRQARPARRPRR